MTTSDPARPSDRSPVDAARLPDHQVEVVAEAGSTNALVAERAQAGGPEGLVVLAEHQTAGRGRLDRSWEAPARSGLTFSVLLRPTVPAASWPWLPLLTGHAVRAALRAAGFDATVKWPNDVLLGERKVAGILVERVETPSGPAAVVGIGLNVGMTADELPVPEATSLAVEGEAPDRTELLGLLLDTLWDSYVAWQEGGEAGAARLATAYAESCGTVGRDVSVALPSGETLTGRAVEIDPSGRLVVSTGSGERTAVGAGDVVHVRDA
ncbi:biotin--[acetyl-CoA-carboxylase] ligase [Nocardioides sp.]|uniref:biotin--[acetyl-CoA-carboxylase] ligase n=1 Tax=Nocardioides sp. TaxID=35761 RepID=UPI001A21AFC5|nr:biotin--[acetyl-CoA-carboxylase] ligase [Nocardioides sp.]MBJ7359463.1 biotin--[acetyl-CoA-carboxylase] ligase [Nocardioides sp.]